MKHKYRVENIDCPGCAAEIEDLILGLPGVTVASIDMDNGVLTLESELEVALDPLRGIIQSIEPDGGVHEMEASELPHEENENDSKYEAASLISAAVVFAAALWSGSYLLYSAAYLLAAYPVLLTAGGTIFTKNFLNEFFLMSFASMAAVAIGKFPEAISVMLFYRIGELLENKAAAKSRRSIKSLLAQKPSIARIMRDGKEIESRPEDVRKGDIVAIRPGEKIPVDGVVSGGESRIDASSLTGESRPESARPGDAVYGGTVNMDGALTVLASGNYEDSSVARIMEMVEAAVSRKSPTERFVTAFARSYTPVVVVIAAAVALIPPLLGFGTFQGWLYRALVLLVISCPCALVISIPLGYFGGIGAASRKGILVKGGSVYDALSGVDRIFFDKTGTLTRGAYEVTETYPAEGLTREELGMCAANAEEISNHPVARSIKTAFPLKGGKMDVIRGHEEAGKGVSAFFKTEAGTETRISAGNESLMRSLNVSGMREIQSDGTVVHVERDGKYLGAVVVSDEIRPESAGAIKKLKAEGLKEIYMLTGDRENTASAISGSLNLSGYRAALMPDGKVSAMRELSGDMKKTAFVGDGINDAPALATAGVGIAMGGLGAQAAVEIADAVILDDSPARVSDLFRIAKSTRVIVKQNIVCAMAVKVLFIGLGIFGIAGLWEAIFADVGVALLAVLNASRTIRI